MMNPVIPNQILVTLHKVIQMWSESVRRGLSVPQLAMVGVNVDQQQQRVHNYIKVFHDTYCFRCNT